MEIVRIRSFDIEKDGEVWRFNIFTGASNNPICLIETSDNDKFMLDLNEILITFNILSISSIVDKHIKIDFSSLEDHPEARWSRF